MSNILTALNVYERCITNDNLMRQALKFYMSKYPQHALASIEEPASNAKLVKVSVPGTDTRNGDKYNWFAHDHVLKSGDIAEFNAIYRKGEKVLAIRECRSRTGLGLKEAKDLCEYLAESGKF